jgi:alpha-D-ribose 1-methylphosphonate 5-triphosphate synthase subunit PhnH
MKLTAGLADHVRDSQRVFRAVLDAMSHPGRVVHVAVPAETPPPLDGATAAFCLALVDLETPLWLDVAARTPEVAGYLRFHCGCPVVENAARARFALVADPRRAPALEIFDPGREDFPEESATLVVQVDALVPGTGRRLVGPGIDGEARLAASGVPAAFWDDLRRNHALFPRGLDVVLTSGRSMAALPRTTRVDPD